MTITVSKSAVDLKEKLGGVDFQTTPVQKVPAGTVVQYVVARNLPNGDITTTSNTPVEISSNMRIQFTPKFPGTSMLVLRYSSSSYQWANGIYTLHTIWDRTLNVHLFDSSYTSPVNNNYITRLLSRTVGNGGNQEYAGTLTMSMLSFNGTKELSPYFYSGTNGSTVWANWMGGNGIQQFEIIEIKQ